MSKVWDQDLPSTDKLVLLALADWSDDQGRCWPSIAQLKEKCGLSERSVQTIIQRMVKAGHLSRQEIVGKGVKYHVHPRSKCTPANSAPPQETADTPAAAAPNTSEYTIPKKDKPSLDTRAKFPAPDGVPDQVWQDFLKSPARRKAGMSPTAYSGITNKLRELAEHGFPPGKMVALAVERGWRTVKLEWVQNDERSFQQSPNSMGRHQSSDGLSPTTRAALDVFGR